MRGDEVVDAIALAWEPAPAPPEWLEVSLALVANELEIPARCWRNDERDHVFDRHGGRLRLSHVCPPSLDRTAFWGVLSLSDAPCERESAPRDARGASDVFEYRLSARTSQGPLLRILTLPSLGKGQSMRSGTALSRQRLA